jgi:hypothetical protein
MAEFRGAVGSTPQTGSSEAARGGHFSQAHGKPDDTSGSSEMWDTAYDQGRRYLQQGRQAVGDLDGVTLTGLFVAGAIGFGVAWLVFGHRSRYADDVAWRMSQSSDRNAPENFRRSSGR